MDPLPDDHALSRARLFLDLADECTIAERTRYEAFIEAAIVFCRAAIHRTQKKYERHPGWQAWWDALKDPDVNFIRRERDFIVKERPGLRHQVIRVGVEVTLAADCYYYEHPDTRATDTLRRMVASTEKHVRDADARFGGSHTGDVTPRF